MAYSTGYYGKRPRSGASYDEDYAGDPYYPNTAKRAYIPAAPRQPRYRRPQDYPHLGTEEALGTIPVRAVEYGTYQLQEAMGRPLQRMRRDRDLGVSWQEPSARRVQQTRRFRQLQDDARASGQPYLTAGYDSDLATDSDEEGYDKRKTQRVPYTVHMRRPQMPSRYNQSVHDWEEYLNAATDDSESEEESANDSDSSSDADEGVAASAAAPDLPGEEDYDFIEDGQQGQAGSDDGQMRELRRHYLQGKLQQMKKYCTIM